MLMDYKKLFASLAALGLGTLYVRELYVRADTDTGPKVLEGIVQKEFGTLPTLMESRGALFGNESVKISDFTYGLVLQTSTGEYTLIVKEGCCKPLPALAEAIRIGDKVKAMYDNYTKIGEDKIGELSSDSVMLMR